jgi:hypothetical protein
MSLGRVLSFVTILAVSLALSSVIVRRHRKTPLQAPEPPRPARVAARAPAPAASAMRAPSAKVPDTEEEVIEDPLSASVCPEGMLLAEGIICTDLHRKCTARGASPEASCRAFEPANCRRGLSVHACVDRYEYPNREGMLPAAVVTYEQAREACVEEGKRLCTEPEWTFACEGPRGLAFSYGDEENPEACNVGKPEPRLATDALWEPKDVAAAAERLDARVASGSTKGCVGPVGARDLVGNVEEWVRSAIPGFERALRGGGYTGNPSCRAVRQIKQPSFRQLHTGFRCCRDPLAANARGKNDLPETTPTVAPRRGFD